jgi:hypothetical protein
MNKIKSKAPVFLNKSISRFVFYIDTLEKIYCSKAFLEFYRYKGHEYIHNQKKLYNKNIHTFKLYIIREYQRHKHGLQYLNKIENMDKDNHPRTLSLAELEFYLNKLENECINKVRIMNNKDNYTEPYYNQLIKKSSKSIEKIKHHIKYMYKNYTI